MMQQTDMNTLPNGKVVGALYKNPIDALLKILRTEGPLGWYKGACHMLTNLNTS
jgi:solute carrier family 25 protein 34/35